MEKIAGYPVLRGRLKADVAVVGGGFTGLTTALWLSRVGLKVVVVEARRIGSGASSNCCGVLSPAYGLTCTELEKKKGRKAAQAYIQTHLKAIQSVLELAAMTGMKFARQKKKGAIVAMNDQIELLEEEAKVLKRAGVTASIEFGASHSLSISKLLCFQPVYTLDAYAYLYTLALQSVSCGVHFFECSRVTGVETDVVYTETGSVQAPYIVIATGYPIVNTPGWFFMRMEQRRREVFRLAGGRKQQKVIFAADHSFTSIPEGDNVLLQVRKSIVGKEDDQEQMVSHWKNELDAQSVELIKAAVETVTQDGLPYIGPYSSRTPNLFVGTGYGGEGLVSSMIAAQAITARILGLPSEGYEIYLPQRGVSGVSVPAQIAGRYLKGLLGGSEAPRCSHMGCKLVYNFQSRLWECPCHGSRFDDIGRVLNAPAIHPALLRGRK